MVSVNQLKTLALDVLLKETFSYVRQNIYDQHVVLAEENARIRGTSTHFFMFNGENYPLMTPTGRETSKTSIRGVTPLHHTLISQMNNSLGLMGDANYQLIRSFFSAVITASYNCLVLDALLPGTLVTAIRSKFSLEDFHAINMGTRESGPVIEDAVAVRSVGLIKTHYEDTISSLQELLMEKLLLE